MNTKPNTSLAAISYLTFIGFLIALIQNQSKKEAFTRFHLVQSLGLILTAVTLSIIAIVPVLGWFIYIVGIFLLLYMWIVSLMNAIKGREKPTPILGEKYIQWLDGIF
jgi:uncharacterized membrane protein